MELRSRLNSQAAFFIRHLRSIVSEYRRLLRWTAEGVGASSPPRDVTLAFCELCGALGALAAEVEPQLRHVEELNASLRSLWDVAVAGKFPAGLTADRVDQSGDAKGAAVQEEKLSESQQAVRMLPVPSQVMTAALTPPICAAI